jgi:hypothetical protein
LLYPGFVSCFPWILSLYEFGYYNNNKKRILINLCGVLGFFLKKRKKEEENRFLIGKEKKNLEVAEKNRIQIINCVHL